VGTGRVDVAAGCRVEECVGPMLLPRGRVGVCDADMKGAGVYVGESERVTDGE